MRYGVWTWHLLEKLGVLFCASCGRRLAQLPMDTYEHETWVCNECHMRGLGLAPLYDRAKAREAR